MEKCAGPFYGKRRKFFRHREDLAAYKEQREGSIITAQKVFRIILQAFK